MHHLKLVVFGLVVAQSVFQGGGTLGADKGNKLCRLKTCLSCLFGKSKNKPSREPSSSKSGPSAKTSNVDADITIEADGTVKGLGPGTKFTIGDLSEALSSVTEGSLSRALGITDNKSELTESIAGAFTELLLAQSLNPKNGAINYATAIVFLQMWNTIPLETMNDFKMVCFLMANMRPLQIKNELPNINTLIPQAFHTFGYNLDRKSELKWINLLLKTYRAVQGDTVAAGKIVRDITDKYAAFDELKKLGNGGFDILKTVIKRVVKFAQVVQSRAKTVPSQT